jgi:hypothetical protein
MKRDSEITTPTAEKEGEYMNEGNSSTQKCLRPFALRFVFFFPGSYLHRHRRH